MTPNELRTLSSTALRRLRTDSLLIAASCLWAFSIIVFFVPSLESLRIGYAVSWLELLLLLLVSALFLQAALRSKDKQARLFWSAFCVGFGLWFLGRASTLLVLPGAVTLSPLITDGLYFLEFMIVIVAIELRLDARNDPLWWLNHVVSAITGVFLLLATFSYLSLVPFFAGVGEYPGLRNLNTAIDGYLLARFVVAALQCRVRSWSRVYWAFAATFALISAADLLAWLYELGSLEFHDGSPLNAIWNLWYGAAYLTSRMTIDAERDDSPAIELMYPRANALLVFGLALPVVHLAGYGFGLLNPAALTARTVFVLIWMLFVAALLLAFQWVMRKRIIKSVENLRTAESRAVALERQLERSLAMGRLGRLSAGLAHDFGNTMSAISMHIKSISDRASIGAINRSDIDGVSRGIEYAQDLVDKLRLFGSAPRSKSVAPMDIVAEVRDTLQLVRPSLKAELRLEFDDQAAFGFALASKTDVHRVLTNFLYNANDATAGIAAVDKTATITVTVIEETISGECASCAAKFSGRYVSLNVSDNGRGVGPDIAEKLFEPLVTSKSGSHGGGLGLAAVHGIVHRIGGHVGWAARPGGGSCFSAYFVATDAAEG